MAEAAPPAPYDARLKRALDALVYSAPGAAPSQAAADSLFSDDTPAQARPSRFLRERTPRVSCLSWVQRLVASCSLLRLF
jgi:hypothetical protein